jgi:hypothetical protein
MRQLIAVPALLALATCVQGGDCRYEAPRQATVDAKGAERVSIHAEAGSLEVLGTKGTQVKVDGRACASSESRLEDIRLEADRRGATVRVAARIPESGAWNGSAALHLVVEVPSGLAVEVEDSSGSLKVVGVRSLQLEDGSGDIQIDDVAGDVSVKDGSGSIDIEGIQGNVRLDDGSGDIHLRDVTGDVEVVDDGSGGIDASAVKGSVRVRHDGSGGISVRDVGGDFVVDEDGSGGIDYEGVEGQVRVPSKK